MLKSHDKIAFRLASILLKFNNQERLTKKELAQEFGVGIRTIERDLNERLSIMPIKKDKEGRYYLEDYVLGKLSFKDIENFAILSGISSLYPRLNKEFIIDLLNLKANQAYIINTQAFENINSKFDEFKHISNAILNHNQIKFIYSDKKRIVNPYNLINNGGIWYLLADDESRLKTFTFSKILNLAIQTTTFVPKQEFLTQIQSGNARWFSGEEKEVVIEIITPKAIQYFTRKQILPNQKIIEQSSDKLVVLTKIAYDDEILSIVRQWIPYIKIISPKSLKDKLFDTLKTYMKD